MALRYAFVLICLTGAAPGGVYAQVVSGDTLKHYELGEIVVGAGRSTSPRPAVSTMQRMPLSAIAQMDGASIDGVLAALPAAHVQTNSRGESHVYLRNAGERQVAIFFDGALLNVPWDNRADLSLIPSDVVGEITVAKGVPSVLYGANVLGGALNLTSRTLDSQGTYTRVAGSVGSLGAYSGNLAHLGRRMRFGYTFSAGYTGRDAIAVPGRAKLPFGQPAGSRRTNTDRELESLFGQITYRLGVRGQLGLSVLRLDGASGIAPEGHIDPQVGHVRYWRYAARTTGMVILSGQSFVGRSESLVRGVVWKSGFDQTIDQYESAMYRQRLKRQRDDDDTYGTRLTFLHPTARGALSLALNGFTTRHQKVEADMNAEGSATTPLVFRQHVWSGGFEYVWDAADQLDLALGLSLDGQATPETGDKPAHSPQTTWGITSGLTYDVNEVWGLRAALGRKVRFPTMRELFGEALGRFLVNPDLRAESAALVEVAVGIAGEDVQAEAITFLNRTFDTIDQRVVQGPDHLPRRMRVNLDGSRVAGFEIVTAARFWRGFRGNANVTWMHSRGFDGEESSPLVEKPRYLGAFDLRYNDPGGLSLLLQANLTGQAYGLAEDNQFVSLPSYSVFHVRMAYLFIRRQFATELFARVNNVTDETTLPQLGLPGPGRDFQAGLEVSF